MTNTEKARYLELIAIAKSDVMLASEFDELLGLQKKLNKQVALVTTFRVALVASIISIYWVALVINYWVAIVDRQCAH